MYREIILTYDIKNSRLYNSNKFKDFLCSQIIMYSYIYYTDYKAIRLFWAEDKRNKKNRLTPNLRNELTFNAIREYYNSNKITVLWNDFERKQVIDFLFPTESTIVIKVKDDIFTKMRSVVSFIMYLNILLDNDKAKMYYYIGLIDQNILGRNISYMHPKDDWEKTKTEYIESIKANLEKYSLYSYFRNKH